MDYKMTQNDLNQHISWFYERKGAYMPTPIIYGDYFYVCRINGILLCYDAKTGEEIYKQRVGSMQGAFTASPVAADGKLYLADEYGDIHIVEAGPEYKLLKTNKLHESCLASPSISGGLLFVRTIGHLFAIGKGGNNHAPTVIRCQLCWLSKQALEYYHVDSESSQ